MKSRPAPIRAVSRTASPAPLGSRPGRLSMPGRRSRTSSDSARMPEILRKVHRNLQATDGNPGPTNADRRGKRESACQGDGAVQAQADENWPARLTRGSGSTVNARSREERHPVSDGASVSNRPERGDSS